MYISYFYYFPIFFYENKTFYVVAFIPQNTIYIVSCLLAYIQSCDYSNNIISKFVNFLFFFLSFFQ